jgi:hypothetical protein
MRLKPRRYAELLSSHPEEAKVVPIAGDAAIATVGTGHGRLIPLVILDTTERPDLAEVIRVQAHFPEGDVVVQWGQLPKRPDHVALFLRFMRPTERAAVIEFDSARQGILVEHTLMSQALYIQAGKAGDRLIHDLNLPKMLIEVPDTGFRRHWDKLYRDGVIARMVNEGLTRKVAKAAVGSYIDCIRELARFRMKSG